MDHDVKIAQQKLACEKIHSSETPSVIFLTHELKKKKQRKLDERRKSHKAHAS
jgi:hypothetical protein